MLTEQQKLILQMEMRSHRLCGHPSGSHCTMLILMGAGLLDSDIIEDPETLQQAQAFIADETLTSLILKGYLETAGVDSEGEITYGLTERGRQYKHDPE